MYMQSLKPEGCFHIHLREGFCALTLNLSLRHACEVGDILCPEVNHLKQKINTFTYL